MEKKAKSCIKTKEIMIRLNDAVGSGAEVLGLLAAAGVNLSGMVGYGMPEGRALLHVVSDNAAKAKKVLAKSGYSAEFRDVLLAPMSNKAGAMALILKKIASAGVNVNYGYGMGVGGSGAAVLYFKDAGDLTKALRKLNAKKG